MKPTISVAEVETQLLELGVKPGVVLLVHTAFSRVRPVEDGPHGLIRALRAAVGPEGTVVMPSMTEDDDTPFDPAATPCRGLGVVADTFWRLPGVLRSDNPHAFAAAGPRAAQITAPHSLHDPHGPETPVGRVHDLDGQVLLLGAQHDANTTVHFAEFLGGARYRRPKHITYLRDGQPTRLDYREIDHCCERFNFVDEWMDESKGQRHGRVGHAHARLMRSRDVVDVVTRRLRADPTIFLHPIGVDEQCDEARASLGEDGIPSRLINPAS